MGLTEEVLKIVGNETRRNILFLLSKEPHYILQLSRKLSVTQPAILKHLSILEKAGLAESFREKSGRGAARKYFKICGSVNIEIAINPEEFKVTRRATETGCAKYLREEAAIKRLTDEINRAKKIDVKAAKALELMREADELLQCRDYSEGDWNCVNCRRMASLKKRAAQVIVHVSEGDTVGGLRMLTEMLGRLK